MDLEELGPEQPFSPLPRGEPDLQSDLDGALFPRLAAACVSCKHGESFYSKGLFAKAILNWERLRWIADAAPEGASLNSGGVSGWN